MVVGLAIIGGGIFAREEHLPAAKASKDLDLKAIWSRSLKSAQTLSTDAKTIDLYSEDSEPGKQLSNLLERSDIQAVIIALPILNQPEYIKKALRAEKHVLSEKPVAENIKDAQELIGWYYASVHSQKIGWSVAENFRYLASYHYAREQILRLGRVLNFRVRTYAMVKPGGKYYKTEWRKSPTHQGGFLLDAGVHFTAGLRLLLGPENTISRLSAFSTQLQPHLPPVDTVDAVLKTKSNVTGTLSISFGSTFTGSEYAIACEGGSVTIRRETVTTAFDGKEEVKVVENERTGVPTEVRDWGEALALGRRNDKQIPEEALADLELLERMLRSGEKDGESMECTLQI